MGGDSGSVALIMSPFWGLLIGEKIGQGLGIYEGAEGLKGFCDAPKDT